MVAKDARAEATRIMRKISGFSLIELMVTVAVLGILVAVAAPSFQETISNNRITTETNGLLGDLSLARSEALKLGGTSVVTVCATTDGSSCAGANVWSAGRLVFLDRGSEGVVDAGDTILRSSAASSGVTVGASGFSTAGRVSYRANGSVSSTSQGTFTVCKSGYLGRVVTVGVTGRAVATKTAANCV